TEHERATGSAAAPAPQGPAAAPSVDLSSSEAVLTSLADVLPSRFGPALASASASLPTLQTREKQAAQDAIPSIEDTEPACLWRRHRAVPLCRRRHPPRMSRRRQPPLPACRRLRRRRLRPGRCQAAKPRSRVQNRPPRKAVAAVGGAGWSIGC